MIVVFYDIFIRLCAQKNVTPSKAAEEIGLNRAAVTKWQRGGKPSAVNLLKLAKYFGVTTEYLLGEEKAPEKNELPATNEELDKALEGVNFALYGEAKDLTVKEKQDVLKFIQFLKSKRGE